MMKSIIVLLMGLLVLGVRAEKPPVAGSSKPDILFIAFNDLVGQAAGAFVEVGSGCCSV